MSTQQPKTKQSSRWGSLLSGAVAGLESRLDTILADEANTSTKPRTDLAENTAASSTKEEALPQSSENGAPKVAQKARPNDRLQERLAKAMSGKQPGSAQGSTSSTPALTGSPLPGPDSPRTSIGSRPSVEITRPSELATDAVNAKLISMTSAPSARATESAVSNANGSETLLDSTLPINPARHSEDNFSRPDLAINGEIVSETPLAATDIEVPHQSVSELEAELAQMRAEREATDRQKQEDMETVLERIDALQAKLQYLAKETVAAAKEANAAAPHGSSEQVLAEKDEKIALLMEEGVTLSKTEMRHLATIRKLNTASTTAERNAADLRKEVSKWKQSESTLRLRIARLEQAAKASAENTQRLSKTELELTSLKSDLDSKEAIISTLRRKIDESEKKIESLEGGSQKTSLASDSKKINDLEEKLSNANIEKKLAEDRAKAEIKRVTQELEQQRNSAQATEMELKAEMSNFEARMETLRLRAEEASSDQTGDAQAKLLRQIETSQTQYTLAAENWRTIESSLNARLTAIEKERDEAVKRETDLRKKSRDLGVKCRKLEEELDSGSDKTSSINAELSEQKALVKKLETNLASAEKSLEDARVEFEQQKQMLETSFTARLDEERKSRPSSIHVPPRKNSTLDGLISSQGRKPFVRGSTNDSMTSLSAYLDRSSTSRRSSTYNDPPMTSPVIGVGRKPSALSLRQLQSFSSPPPAPSPIDIPPSTPSIQTETPFDDISERPSASPRGGSAADVISAATVHTGPSVQLVERMSSSIRRLEAEKAARADELARVTAQRDDARQQMVALVREAEETAELQAKIAEREGEVATVTTRYDACLEMLGEREEEVQELRENLEDMRRIYKELVDKMGHT